MGFKLPKRNQHGFTILPVDKNSPLGEGQFTHAVYLNGVFQNKFLSERAAKSWIKAMTTI
jgi:hypothetical protein